ncbi:MAG TPA: aminopeptidase, partial [Candidatus Fermentibacter daniensis]|nr:aminopeptidase [Candidatus Fermentibacter daniensis]
TDSPIYRSGRIFHSILFDENAAIHIALGNGYTECVEGMKSADNERLLANGCNVSLVHTDFMVGSDEVGVDGLDKAGNATRIISAGRFVI